MQFRNLLFFLPLTSVLSCGQQEKQYAVAEAEVVMYHNGYILTMEGDSAEYIERGFIDGHSHPTNYADALMQADLNPPPIGRVTDIPGIIRAVQALKDKSCAKYGVETIKEGKTVLKN